MSLVNIPDNAGYWKFRDQTSDVFNKNFRIFLQFVRHKCGNSFMDGLADGSVKVHFMDTYAAYSADVYVSQIEKYAAMSNAPAKKYWSMTVQGHTGNNLEFSALPHNANKLRGDMPFSAKTQEFNTRKDQIQVLFTGLDDVVFSDAQLDACLTGAFVGVQEWDGSTMENHSECVALSHIYW